MTKRAKPFWTNEKKVNKPVPTAPYVDIALIATGVSDDAWKFGSD